jgi:hypothetical protein
VEDREREGVSRAGAILVLTGDRSRAATELECLGADAIIAKPIDPGALIRRLRERPARDPA